MITELDEIAYDIFIKETNSTISITFFIGFNKKYALKKYYKQAKKKLRKDKINNIC